MHALGRLMQLVGLGLPLVAVVMQLGNHISVRDMLLMLVAAACLFYLGRYVEGYFRRP